MRRLTHVDTGTWQVEAFGDTRAQAIVVYLNRYRIAEFERNGEVWSTSSQVVTVPVNVAELIEDLKG